MAPSILKSRLLWTGASMWAGALVAWALLLVVDRRAGGAVAATFGAFLLAGKLAAIPVGLSFKLAPIIVGLTVLVPDIAAIFLFYPLTQGGLEVLGKWSMFIRRQEERARAAAQNPKGFLARYGSWGLFALSLAPVGFYSPLAVSAIGQAMGLSARRVLFPVVLASALMTIFLVYAFSAGLTALAYIDRRLPFLASLAVLLTFLLQDLIRRRLKARKKNDPGPSTPPE